MTKLDPFIWNAQRRRNLAVLAAEGLSMAQIVNRLGRSEAEITAALDAFDITLGAPLDADALPVPPQCKHQQQATAPPWSEADLDRLKDLHGQGLTNAQIAEAMDRTEKAVNKRLWALNIKRQKRTRWTPESIARLREMSRAGRSLKQIGKAMGCSPTAARLARIRHGCCPIDLHQQEAEA